MNTLIFKTNIESKEDFDKIKNALSNKKQFAECTIDLDDVDKVLRILSDKLTVPDVEEEVVEMGFYCKEIEE